ncbi:protein PTOV1 homolog [Schistocerca gregaria]|uniref:protein PTOV1 homolog n=1 Tax=Schistocerca gregaria TaxID=7010 RepID=UPI00211E1BC6|nr:protein PTOV1 homolog [Schistocerca gregaria]
MVPVQQQQSQQQQQVPEYQTCWQGTLQWVEKIENPTNINEIPCQISMHPEDKQDWNADTWPQKLVMQLVPKQLMAVIDGFVLYNSNPLHFHPQNCKALESVIKIMRYGFAGCVHFKSISPEAESDLKYVVLLYISNQNEFVGFIPKNQKMLLDNLSRALNQKMPSLILRSQSQELVLEKRHTQQQQQQQQQGQQQPQQQQQQQQPEEEHQTLWEGLLEWIDNTKSLNDADQVIRHIPCRISRKPKDGAPDLKADSWPLKLTVHLVPIDLLGVVGGIFLKNSNLLHFHPENCEALELLTGALSSGYAGYVHFKKVTPTSECDVKVVVLLYESFRNEYVGAVPNDDAAYMAAVQSAIRESSPSEAALIQKTAEWNAKQLSKALGSSCPVRNIRLSRPLARYSGLPHPPTVRRTGSPRSQTPEQDQQILLAQQQQSQQEQQQQQQQQGPGGTMQGCQEAEGPGPQQPPIDNMEVAQQETLLESQLRCEEIKTEQEEEMQEKSQLEELEK